MLRRKFLLENFMYGMSVLSSYIHHSNCCNMQDINILSESFMADLLNILYGWKLQNANDISGNTKGYDLISPEDKILFQVSATDSPAKIISTLKKLETNDFAGYTLYFLILRDEAVSVHKYKGQKGAGYTCPPGIVFDPDANIYDFSTLVAKVKSLPEVPDTGEEQAFEAGIFDRLEKFMQENSNLFLPSLSSGEPDNKVNTVLQEYSDNFTERLFRHRYEENSLVTLDRMYVEPKLTFDSGESWSLMELLDRFLWGKDRKEVLFLEGDAALGKTSIVSYLCYHYLKKDDIGKALFLTKKLVCIRLRELDFSDNRKNVQQVLLDYLGFSSAAALKKDYDGCILLLDGADELGILEGWGSAGLEELFLGIRKLFRYDRMIVTSRPHFINQDRLARRHFDIENAWIQHFDQDMREQWLEKYENCGEVVPQETKEYILNLDNKKALGVADTPLALYLLVACEIREELQGNIWALYHEIFGNAIINTDYNENFDSSVEHPVKKQEKLLTEVVGRIAFYMYQNLDSERFYITSEELGAIIQDTCVSEEMAQWLKKCCVLCAYWKSNGKKGALEFYHNNIRDYFFCEYLYGRVDHLLREDSAEGRKRFLTEMCEVLSYGDIAAGTWAQTYLFFHERLRYEKENGKRRYEDEKVKACLDGIFKRILCRDEEFLCYSYDQNGYARMKYALANILLLLRIYQKGLGLLGEDEQNWFWDSTADAVKVMRCGILSDWKFLFEEKIELPNERTISIGQQCIFHNVSFEWEQLKNSDFTGSDFSGAVFEHACLRNVSFRGCDLTLVSFQEAILENVDFTGAVLADVNFVGATLKDCAFDEAQLSDCVLLESRLTNCSFRRAKIENLNFGVTHDLHADFENTICMNCNFDQMKMRGRLIVDSVFIDCSIESPRIRNTLIRNNRFTGCVGEENFADRMP